MPTTAGIPMTQAAPGYVGPLNPVNWLDISGSEALGLQQGMVMRGHPPALSWWMRTPPGRTPTFVQGQPFWLQSRPYDRGAGAFSPKFGVLNINPIGSGVYAPFRIPTIAGPGARYEAAAIWFDVQSVPTSLNFGPTVPIETVNALIATSHVGASYLTTG